MTLFGRQIYFILFLLLVGFVLPNTVIAAGTPLYLTVEKALSNNPKLQAFNQSRQAMEYDLKQARGGYLPTVDLQLGYGLEQHSDASNRLPGAQPSDSDWDPRTDATLKLIQKVYDGGETGSQIQIRKALLDSTDYRLQALAQRVALDAVTAHLNVFRQRQLVALAEKNLKIHREIHKSLDERERAGAGSIADVSQAQARLSRSESTLYLSQADLNRTIANYTHVVGAAPGVLAYAGIPETLPQSLAEIQQQVEEHNPELMAVGTEILEAESRLSLARTNYKPKFDLELSSRYNDQLEGDTSWQNTNAAMLNLRWNLYNGGQDKAGARAALSRASQSRSMRTVKLDELTEAAASAWTEYLSLQRQKEAFLEGVNYSRKTFDAYLKQFSVSQRSLLDVLSAENEYFQAATQLISVDVNETLAAYQLLSLSGQIQAAQCSDDLPDFYLELGQGLKLPGAEVAAPLSEPLNSNSMDQDIQEFIEHWATSWRGQNLEKYFACYSEHFLPEGGNSYQDWRTQRNRRLRSPDFIDLFVSNIQVLQQSDSLYQVSFIQEYRSDRYQDRVRKNLLLELQSGRWAIVREISQPLSSLSSMSVFFPLQSPAEEDVSPQKATVAKVSLDPVASIEAVKPEIPSSLVRLEVGPCLNQRELDRAIKVIRKQGYSIEQVSGSGVVKLFRLFEGLYPQVEGRKKLVILKKTAPSAFVLAQEGQLGLYAGSFRDLDRAKNYIETLGKKNIKLTLVANDVDMKGTFLVVSQTDQGNAEKLAGLIENLGLGAHLKKG